ncbi:hypothetical protein CO664_08060 [Sinorhizobium sp. NG07B]|nr:hypothetical protein CO664_08060 [Sinorhizobium sp. NG07B]
MTEEQREAAENLHEAMRIFNDAIREAAYRGLHVEQCCRTSLSPHNDVFSFPSCPPLHRRCHGASRRRSRIGPPSSGGAVSSCHVLTITGRRPMRHRAADTLGRIQHHNVDRGLAATRRADSKLSQRRFSLFI